MQRLVRFFLLGVVLPLTVLVTARAQEPAGSGSIPYDVEGPARVIDLPDALREVSGLAVLGPRTVLAHDDERARLFRVDLDTGATTPAVTLGRPTLRGDFEGIALAGSKVFLLLSDGRIVRAALPETLGAGVRQLSYRVDETGLGGRCESEGLAAFETGFLIACKEIGRARLDDASDTGFFELHAWQPGRTTALYRRFSARTLGEERINLSAVAVDPGSRRLYLLAARQRLLIALDADGTLTSARLKKKRHPQPEGLALMPNGDLVIADEADKKKDPGRLHVYSPSPSAD